MDGSWPHHLLVIHNEAAGDASRPSSLVHGVLKDAGYRPRYLSADEDWQRALGEDAVDLVVLVGGDGTVSRAVRRLAGRDIPVAILPTGTANNLAKAMGIAGDARDVVRRWREHALRPLDVWEVGPAGAPAHPFVEAVGGGVFASLFARDRELESPTFILGAEWERALHLLRTVAREEPEASWGLVVDGVDHSGGLIGLEILNGRYLGPNIPLAPDASPGDGALDAVLLRAGDRARLLGRFESLASAQSATGERFETVRGRDIRFRPPGGVALHLDGDRWTPAGESDDGWLRVGPAGFVRVLVARRGVG